MPKLLEGLAGMGRQSADREEAESLVDREVRYRVRASGMTAISRAVTELVNVA